MSLFKTLTIDGAGDFGSYSAQVMSVAGLLNSKGLWSDLLADIGTYFLDKIEDNYETSGNEVGGFTVLSHSYAEQYKGGDVTPNLQLTGAYREGWQIDDYEDDGIIIHNPEWESTKHRWHEFGTVKMSMRPVLNLLDEDLAFIDGHFAEAFDTQVFRRL